MARASVKKSTIAKAGVEERKLIRDNQRRGAQSTKDSYLNAVLKLGIGTDNPLSASTYGFNPITRIRTLLEWIYRGSWMGGIAVDIIADDMTRAGIDITTQLKPDEMDRLKKCEVNLDFWGAVNSTIKWSRLYGGAIMVMLIDGQDLSTPLRLDDIPLMKGQLKGFLVLDRWQVEAKLDRLVSAFGPDIGLPVHYRVNSDAPALRGKLIHYSRCLRMVGVDLPYWQRVQENLWGLSVFERLYDRMVSLDSSTQGAAQLVYKSFLRTYKMKGMTDLMSQGGDAGIATMLKKMDMVRRFQNNEGLTVVDADDDITVQSSSAFTGISEVILQQAQQMSGTLQIPLVRMFGQSPAGLNSSGESDLRTYYDGIKQQQERVLRRPIDQIYRAMAMSEGIQLPADFNWQFAPLWQLDEGQKSEISARDTTSIIEAHEAQLIDTPTAMRELKQNSKTTSRFDNVTDEMINAAELEPTPMMGELGDLGLGDDEIAAHGGDPSHITHENPNNQQSALEKLPHAGNPRVKPQELKSKSGQAGSSEKPSRDRRLRARGYDSLPSYHVAGIQVAIENMAGSTRTGPGWSVVMPADYGHIPAVGSAEGDMEWMDAFVGPARDSQDIWVADMVDPRTGKFDEHKCMMGFTSEDEARECLELAYPDDHARRITGLTHMSADKFSAWLRSGNHTRAVKKLEMAA
jgi:phage-related protein (TIGR01555 family)